MGIDFRERGRKTSMRERYQLIASYTRPNWGQTSNLGMCPDRESNPQPFGPWEDAPTN